MVRAVYASIIQNIWSSPPTVYLELIGGSAISHREVTPPPDTLLPTNTTLIQCSNSYRFDNVVAQSISTK